MCYKLTVMRKNKTFCLNLFFGARKPETSLRSQRVGCRRFVETICLFSCRKSRLLHNSYVLGSL